MPHPDRSTPPGTIIKAIQNYNFLIIGDTYEVIATDYNFVYIRNPNTSRIHEFFFHRFVLVEKQKPKSGFAHFVKSIS